MSSSATDATKQQKTGSDAENAPPSSKGKAKAKAVVEDSMDEDEEDGEEDEDEEIGSEEEEDNDSEDEAFEEIDPSVILPTGRRTRGVRVDYTSKEALAKAGLKENEDDEDDDDVDMKD